MVTLVDRKLALQSQNTDLQTSLSGLQQKLTSLQDFTQLSAIISHEFKINEGDYFVTETMVTSLPNYSEIKKLQDEAIVFAEETKGIESGLNGLEAELKKGPADKATLDKIKHKLNVLLTPKDSPLKSGDSLHDLLSSVAAQMNNKQFKANFDAIKLLTDHVSVEKTNEKTKDGKKNIYKVFPSLKGKALVASIKTEERVGRDLDDLTTRTETQSASMPAFTQHVTQFEADFMTKVRERAKQAVQSAIDIAKNNKQAEKLLKKLDRLKSKAEALSARYLELNENSSLSDMGALATDMAQAITDIEAGKGDVNNSKAAQALKLLTDAKSMCVKSQEEFEHGKIWKKLLKKTNKKKEILTELPGKLEIAFQRLCQEKESLDQRIAKEKTRLLEKDNDRAAQARYLKATDAYLNRLQKSIKEHLELFEKKAKDICPDPYDYIATKFLKVGDKKDVDNVFESLKTCYEYRGDLQKQTGIDYELMKADPKQQREPFESFKDTLHKYRLMTELKAAATESSKKFLDVLKIDKNKEILAKRRDSSFMLWAKECGKPVAAILGLLDYAYGYFFSPKGKNFVDQFENDVRNNARHSLFRPGA